MLPEGLPLSYIDRGVRHLVVTLNRIPGINTQTTCEGHIWADIPLWPTKDGWVNFNRPNGSHEGLIEVVQGFCSEIPFFEFTTYGGDYLSNHTIRGRYEDHTDYHGGIAYSNRSKDEQKAYLERARIRRQQILQGWTELDGRVINYIKENITQDPFSLPFRNKR